MTQLDQLIGRWRFDVGFLGEVHSSLCARADARMYSARTERVEANTPHYLPPLPANEPHNSLALAKWTVSPENPLTARVTVNRMWYELFGTGLVETTEDFGIMGQRPSHPELLDWLAVEFRESGWNVKHMYKLMVMSAAYRQSAKSTPGATGEGPQNLAALARPAVPHGCGDAARYCAAVRRAAGEQDWRTEREALSAAECVGAGELSDAATRSITRKTMATRSTAAACTPTGSAWRRLPNMDAFDAPMRDVVCTRRQRTDTPLQALVTMNDVQWVEAARALAERVIHEGGPKPEKRIDRMSEILLAHDPAAADGWRFWRTHLVQMQKHYASESERCPCSGAALAKRRRDSSIPEPELAAWTMIASEMLNLDETVTK